MPSQRIKIKYRRMDIFARQTTKCWEARAFDNGVAVTDTVTGQSEDEVITEVKGELDENAADEFARRESDGIPTAEFFCAALKRLKPTDGQLAMLEAHYRADGHVLTATQLAEAAGQQAYGYANSQYGRLARSLAEEMDYTPAVQHGDGSPVWTYTLATGVNGEEIAVLPEALGEWIWKMRPQVVESLRLYGL